MPMPCSPTPAGPNHQAIQWFDAAPVNSKTEARRGLLHLGAQSHGLGTGCLRFAVTVGSDCYE